MGFNISQGGREGNRREKAVEVEVGNVSLLLPLAGCYCYLTAVPAPVQVLFNGIDNKDALSFWSHIARSTIPLPNIRSRLWICSIIIHTGRAAPAPTSLHSTCEALLLHSYLHASVSAEWLSVCTF